MVLVPTPSQTVGPFFNFGLTTDASLGKMAREGARGERIPLSFRVTDGNGDPTASDSMIELWQADADGHYRHEADPRSSNADRNFSCFGRLEGDLMVVARLKR